MSSDFYARQAGYLLAVARGQVPGASPFGAFGRHTSTGAVNNQIIWPDGVFTIPSASGIQLSFVSTSASDGVGGTGIRQLELDYLDGNLDPQVELVTLNGLTPVLSVATDIRFVQELHGHVFGTGKAAAGIVAATQGGATYGYIPAAYARSSSSARMVPRGKRMFVADMAAGATSGTASAAVQIEAVCTQHDARLYTADGIFFPQGMVALQDDTASLSVSCPVPFVEGAVFAMRATSDKAATFSGTWYGWLENAA